MYRISKEGKMLNAKEKMQQLLAKWEQKAQGTRWYTTLSKKVVRDSVVLTPQQYKKAVRIAAAAVVVLVLTVGIGIYEYVSLQQVREREALHEQQLEIMREKTASLQDKMNKMDALDQELRQMVKGSGTGDSPKGEGGVAGAQKKSPDVSNANYNDLLLATSRLETRTNARIVSFITLKTVLGDTAGTQVRQMQQISKQYKSSSTPTIWPVNGTITSNFGYRGNPIGGGTGFHEGLDIAVDYGTPVHVTASGKVTMAGWVDGYGNLVEVDHGNGFVTRYGHNSMLLVVVGQEVQTGDIIALAGSTGRSTGPHCHYEVRVNGTPTDPLIFLH
jgi:murein DD-endopeptidase MepM/ murein hydrolase activator NlpD